MNFEVNVKTVLDVLKFCFLATKNKFNNANIFTSVAEPARFGGFGSNKIFWDGFGFIKIWRLRLL